MLPQARYKARPRLKKTFRYLSDLNQHDEAWFMEFHTLHVESVVRLLLFCLQLLNEKTMRALIIVFTLFPAIVFCQNDQISRSWSELTEWNLKGKVRKITNYIFDNVNAGFGQSSVIDTNKCSRVNTVVYNTMGNAISFYNIMKSKSGGIVSRNRSIVSYADNCRYSIDILNEDTFSYAKRQWVSDSSYTDTIKNNQKMNIVVYKTVLHKNGVVNYQISESLKEYDVSGPVKFYFTFNAKGRLVEIITHLEDGRIVTESNADLAFDKTGNAVKSMKKQKNTRTFIFRKFEYY